MSLSNFKIRRWYKFEDETLATEIGKEADGAPLRKIAIAAVIKNPYATGEYTQDLSAVVESSPALGREMGKRLLASLGEDKLASIGKACVVGVNGEYEHGNAFLTATMADPLRDVLGGGQAWIASTGKRGGPGVTIDVPLAHKDALYVRSHYDTMTLMFPDGPNADEVVIIIVVATRGRLHARLGGLSEKDVVGKDGLH